MTSQASVGQGAIVPQAEVVSAPRLGSGPAASLSSSSLPPSPPLSRPHPYALLPDRMSASANTLFIFLIFCFPSSSFVPLPYSLSACSLPPPSSSEMFWPMTLLLCD